MLCVGRRACVLTLTLLLALTTSCLSPCSGGISGAGFGCAPMEAQEWWDKTGASKGCGGATKTNGTFCE
eukprot:SAG22_NODE_217_length_14910_cov_65.532978_2_plen_69_part_00